MQTCKQCQTQTTMSQFDNGICDGCWLLNQEPKTKEEARAYAIDWQNWQVDQNLSYGELAAWQDKLHTMALDFDLLEEFKENGLI